MGESFGDIADAAMGIAFCQHAGDERKFHYH